jgi:hypothetical protein
MVTGGHDPKAPRRLESRQRTVPLGNSLEQGKAIWLRLLGGEVDTGWVQISFFTRVSYLIFGTG